MDDRRGRRAPGRQGMAVGGCGSLLLVLALSYFTGANPLELLGMLERAQVSVDPGATGRGGGGAGPAPPGQDEQAEFVSVVLADTEDTWTELFGRMGRSYELPRLELFTGAVRSACGMNSAASGPFYCPADSKVYIDLSFFAELDRRFGAPGDFAQAYVIAHEVGHHVQNVLGISDQVRRMQSNASREEANQWSVRLELQADCFAGVWGHHANRKRAMLEPGDVEEGLAAAAAIGDDNIQRQAGGRVNPESWTHGSSEQRVEWLRRGLASGDPEICATL